MKFKNNIIICKKVAYEVNEFIDICIKCWTRTEAANFFGCSEKTLGLVLKTQLPELQPSTAPLGKRLLALKNLKKCSKCAKIGLFEDFVKDKHTKDGTTSQCKNCRYGAHRVYKKTNPEAFKESQTKTCKKRHKERLAANSNYRAKKLQRTPKWANLEKIREIYKNCPEGYHVDHIIPLQGEKVSGLHVPENLQYLTAEENLSKSNKYEEE